MKAYLANGLFNEADRMYNAYLAKMIRENVKGIDLYVPQENDAINDKNAYADSIMIVRADYEKLKESDLLIAIIDGNDNGVSVEIGMAYALGIKMIGLFTDVRQQGRDNEKKIKALIEDGTENQFIYHNLMEIGAIKEKGVIVDNANDLVKEVKKFAEQHT